MGAERGLRQRIRAAIRAEYPAVMVVGQPANGMTGPGRHDLYVIVRGVYVGLEVKTSTGRTTPIQLDRIRDTRRAGGWAWIVRSIDAALGAVNAATWGPPKKEHMTDDFDLDKLLAGFRPDDKEDPDRPIAGFTPSEEHVAAAAQANGSAAGDGEALGEDLTANSALARAIDNLASAVRDLAVTARQMRAAQEASATLDAKDWPEERALSEETDLLESLLKSEPEAPPEPPAPPPSKSPRRRRS